MMIVTKTPIRISFFSGGSDLPAFYRQEMGAALSVTINKFIYVCCHKTTHIGIKTMYDVISEAENLDDMEHIITRESLNYFGYKKELTVASISDILSKGSGLGSSSSFTVGLVNGLYNMKTSGHLSPRESAEIACDIEMSRCGYPVGKQDQYAASYGGFNLFEFNQDGSVKANKIDYSDNWVKLENSLLLVYSGRNRSANQILQKQANAMIYPDKMNLVRKSRDKAYQAVECFKKGDIESFGHLLHTAWTDKKSVVAEITQDYFDMVYQKAIGAGAWGGKLLGAGGGGFFIFSCDPAIKDKVALEVTKDTDCKVYDFSFYNQGSKVITIG